MQRRNKLPVGTANAGRNRPFAATRTPDAAPICSTPAPEDRLQDKKHGMQNPTDRLYCPLFPLHPKRTHCSAPNIHCTAPARVEPPRVRFAAVNVPDADPLDRLHPKKDPLQNPHHPLHPAKIHCRARNTECTRKKSIAAPGTPIAPAKSTLHPRIYPLQDYNLPLHTEYPPRTPILHSYPPLIDPTAGCSREIARFVAHSLKLN